MILIAAPHSPDSNPLRQALSVAVPTVLAALVTLVAGAVFAVGVVLWAPVYVADAIIRPFRFS